MKLQITTVTHKGLVRSENQDAAVNGSSILMDGPGTMRTTLYSPTIAAVIDGMGGHAGGRQAAFITARRLAAIDPLSGSCVDQVRTALHEAEDALRRQQTMNRALEGLGCVATILVADGGLILLNIGDAPALRLDHGYLTRLHTPDVSAAGLLTASIGGSTAAQPAEPHLLPLRLEPGTPMVMCSDGLTDAVSDDQLEELLRAPDAGLAGRLLDVALAGGAPDNVTVSVVDMDGM